MKQLMICMIVMCITYTSNAQYRDSLIIRSKTTGSIKIPGSNIQQPVRINIGVVCQAAIRFRIFNQLTTITVPGNDSISLDLGDNEGLVVTVPENGITLTGYGVSINNNAPVQLPGPDYGVVITPPPPPQLGLDNPVQLGSGSEGLVVTVPTQPTGSACGSLTVSFPPVQVGPNESGTTVTVPGQQLGESGGGLIVTVPPPTVGTSQPGTTVNFPPPQTGSSTYFIPFKTKNRLLLPKIPGTQIALKKNQIRITIPPELKLFRLIMNNGMALKINGSAQAPGSSMDPLPYNLTPGSGAVILVTYNTATQKWDMNITGNNITITKQITPTIKQVRIN